MSPKPIKIAYSSDSDDAFMYLALEEGAVAGADDYRFSFYRGDIQELNERAKRSEFDITAISIALYPKIAVDYSMMTVGTSVAEDHGPVVIAPKNSSIQPHDICPDSDDKAKPQSHIRLALPGQDTTVNLVCQRLLKNYQPQYMHFLDILPAVLTGKADAGVLIHELQLTGGDTDVRIVLDLAQLWHARYHLPLALGGNVISNRLARIEQEKLAALVRASIALGLKNKQATLKKALAASNAPIDMEQGNTYIDRYVNATTLTLDTHAMQSINLLLKPHIPDITYASDITYVGGTEQHAL